MFQKLQSLGGVCVRERACACSYLSLPAHSDRQQMDLAQAYFSQEHKPAEGSLSHIAQFLLLRICHVTLCIQPQCS